MDHRWDELLQAEHRRRIEEGRYGARPIESDEDIARRDQLALARRRVNKSPWEIGASHWDQRDLYTTNARIDDAGYARGPSVHPDIGSYAYPRGFPQELGRDAVDLSTVYEREAYPWRNYEPVEPSSPNGSWRSETSIREGILEAFAEHPDLDASDIGVKVKNAEVTLEGTVRDQPSKRLAETISVQCPGVIEVHNRLTIRKSDDDLAFTAPIPAM